jgi:hypothetical protein
MSSAMWWHSRASPDSTISPARVRVRSRIRWWCTAPVSSSDGIGASPLAGSAPVSASAWSADRGAPGGRPPGLTQSADPSLAGLGQRTAAAGGDGTGHAGESRPAESADGAGTGQAVVVLDIEGLAELAPAVRSRVLRQAALAAGCPAGSLAATHVGALDALVTGWHGQRWADLPGVIRARRRYGKLLFSKGGPAGAGQPEPTEAEATFGRE